MRQLKLRKLETLRTRVNREQVRCDMPECAHTAYQVVSIQVGPDTTDCFAVVVCKAHHVADANAFWDNIVADILSLH